MDPIPDTENSVLMARGFTASRGGHALGHALAAVGGREAACDGVTRVWRVQQDLGYIV